MKRAKPKPDLLTRKELADALDVAPLTVTRWQDEGLPIAHHGGRGRASLYDLEACRSWREARDRVAAAAAAERASKGLDPVTARAEREHWQAALARQMHEQRARTLLPAEEVERVWAGELEAARAQFLAFPTTFADRLHRAATLRGVRGVEAELRSAVHQVLRELAAPPDEAVRGNGHGKPKPKPKRRAPAKPKPKPKRRAPAKPKPKPRASSRTRSTRSKRPTRRTSS